MKLSVDHLVYAVPDFEAGVETAQHILGIQATLGGQHPNWGTRNALITLGPEIYLEIIGPDPTLSRPSKGRVFGIDNLKEPKLVTWAAKATDLPQRITQLSKEGLHMGEVLTGSRIKPNGTQLTWRLTDPYTVLGDGLLPFLIDWGNGPHPTTGSVEAGRLLELRGEHPRPAEIKYMLEKLDLELSLQSGPAPALIATIETRRGTVLLS